MSQNIVIVGAGSGVSLSIAKKFGQNGFRAILVARRKEALEEYKIELANENISAVGYVGDAGDTDSLNHAFDEIKKREGVVDVLVYNAAVFSPGMPSEIMEETLVHDFKVNVAGALIAAQKVIPDMKRRRDGTILLTGGGFALHPFASFASLSIGKAGLRSLAYTLGEELKPHGIYVGTVTIGGIVKPGTYYDPHRIADVFYGLYQSKADRELIYTQQ